MLTRALLLTTLLAILSLPWAVTRPEAQVSTRITSGGTLPTTCSVGGLFAKTGASAGLYVCLATNTWSAVGGATALSAITAATTTNTIASGNNHSQVWNWALTTAASTAMTVGETTAATNGGTNQALVDINTLANSTAMGLRLKCYGNADTCLKVDDESGDTTPFWLQKDGAVGVNVATVPVVSTSALTVGGNIGVTDGTNTLRILSASSEIGTSTAVPLVLFANNGTSSATFAVQNGAGTLIRYGNGVSSITRANNYLQFGGAGGETADGNVWLMGFGWGSSHNPAYIGYTQTTGSNFTTGDLVFGTREATTDTVAGERMRIVSDGTVNIDNLKTTGAATGKNVVCVDTSTGKLYASSSGVACAD